MKVPSRLEMNLEKKPSEWVMPYLLGALSIAFFTYLALLPAITSRWLDFPVYWAAGKKALMGATVYDVEGHFQYKYSPLIALIFGKLFQGISFEAASWYFQKAMLSLWAILFARFANRDFRALALLVVFFGNALRLDLELGQINALVLFVLVALFGMLARPTSGKEDILFGIVFSFAVQLKLFSLVLLPLLIFRHEWRKLALGVLFLPIISVGGVALAHGLPFAIAENRAWFSSLTDSTDLLLLSNQNVGALGFFSRVFGLALGKIFWFALGTGFMTYLWQNRRRPVEWFRDGLLYSVAVFNPLVWSYWILFSLPLFVSYLPEFVGAFLRKSWSTRIQGGLATLLVLAAFNGQHARWAWSWGIFLGLLILGWATSRVRAHPHRMS